MCLCTWSGASLSSVEGCHGPLSFNTLHLLGWIWYLIVMDGPRWRTRATTLPHTYSRVMDTEQTRMQIQNCSSRFHIQPGHQLHETSHSFIKLWKVWPWAKEEHAFCKELLKTHHCWDPATKFFFSLNIGHAQIFYKGLIYHQDLRDKIKPIIYQLWCITFLDSPICSKIFRAAITVDWTKLDKTWFLISKTWGGIWVKLGPNYIQFNQVLL